jgi:hypothetical protein
MTWAAAEFGEVIMGAGGSEEVYIMEDIDG